MVEFYMHTVHCMAMLGSAKIETRQILLGLIKKNERFRYYERS